MRLSVRAQGQRLFTIHSPELVVAEREYLLPRTKFQKPFTSTVPGVAEGVASLSILHESASSSGHPEQEIARLESTGQGRSLEIVSPFPATSRNERASDLKRAAGTRLYTIADLSAVWVLAQIFQNDLARIRIGAPNFAQFGFLPLGAHFEERLISFTRMWNDHAHSTRAPPLFKSSSSPHGAGSVVNGHNALGINSSSRERSLQSGTGRIVSWTEVRVNLEPRECTGTQQGPVLVLKGLKAGERIVTSATCLIDSESRSNRIRVSPVSPLVGRAWAHTASTARNSSYDPVILLGTGARPRRRFQSVPWTLAASRRTPSRARKSASQATCPRHAANG